jgi:hypothetical protein
MNDDAEWMLVKLGCPRGHSHVTLVPKGEAARYHGAQLVRCPQDDDEEDECLSTPER